LALDGTFAWDEIGPFVSLLIRGYLLVSLLILQQELRRPFLFLTLAHVDSVMAFELMNFRIPEKLLGMLQLVYGL
jgi:hypothetical protein